MSSVFKLGKQMKPTIEHEGLPNFSETTASEYKAVSLKLCPETKMSIVQFPLPINSTDDRKPTKKTRESFDLKEHIDEIIEIVHGSQLSKAELAKQIIQKLPTQLPRKAEKVKTFLKDYCSKGGI